MFTSLTEATQIITPLASHLHLIRVGVFTYGVITVVTVTGNVVKYDKYHMPIKDYQIKGPIKRISNV